MPYRLFIFGLILLTSPLGACWAAAETAGVAHPQEFGSWNLSYDVLTDNKGYCRLGHTWPNGVFMEFVSFGPKQAPVISAINPAWNIAENAAATITFEADGGDRRTFSFQRLSSRQAIDPGADGAVAWALGNLAAGKKLVAIFANDERYSLDLTLGQVAHQKFDECANAWAGKVITKDANGVQVASSAPPNQPAAPNTAATPPQPSATGGTGFAFTHDGIIITNSHVIAGCHAIVAVTQGRKVPAAVVAEDQTNDLAAIRAEGLTFDRVASVSAPNTTAIGEKAVTYGFPLYGALASDGNFTIGYVSALSGMRDDSRFVQISTPVQPGNSGGPLLGVSGNLIGVVTGKLDAVKMEKISGQLPENVNFAIKAETLSLFLQKNHIPLNPPVSEAEKTDVELAAIGHAIAVRIACGG